ncbi:kinesin-like protein KIN-14I isoform X1 [Salvia splendens]|uniref:kinesin-like protein KIN-14I isoform X1 n=1 Tax=Salvia splendens TaxID=180675 RepID=UPI001C253CA1|nr:kinesin-like protein KIN-14I isoform X1 [Salvia splendens]
MADGMLRINAAAAEEDALGMSPNDMDLASRKAEEASLRRYDAAAWLRKMVGVLTARDLSGQPSEEDFRLALRSGIILCNALNMIQPGAVPKVAEAPSGSAIVPDGAVSAFQYFENVRNFLNSAEEIGIPVFEASDLEQGGKSSRIVNCVLALKSYCEWKEGGGKGVWKFTGTWKPHSASKKFVKKSSAQFANSLSRTSSIVEQNSQDFNEMGTPDALHLFVRELLSGKKQEDVPLIVGSMLSKVMEQFEQQLARQNEQAGASLRCVDVPSSDEHQVVEIGTNSRDTDVPSSYATCEVSNIMKDKSWSKNDLRDGNPKRHGSKRHDLVEYYQKSVQELKSTLHSTKEDLHFLHMKYQEEIQYLGKHLNGLAGAASRYQKVLEENCKLYNQVQDLKGNIRVYCRIRPFLPGQLPGLSTAEALDSQTISIITPAKNGKGKKLFTFNKVFGPSASQEGIFSDTQPLIRSVLDGYNVCIFAYGQTGSGKTYTMTGPKELTPESLGVNYRALSDLFAISKQRKDSMSYDVSVQMIEIYNEQVRDLLVSDGVKEKLEIRNSSQNGINLPNTNIVPVSSISDVIELMNIGLKNRAVGSTPMNDRSSRSHSCMTVHVQGRNLTSGSITRGSMHLVDLAGSERADKTGVAGDRLTEAQHINHSLSALGDVIASLAQKQSHVPYRNSKLTQLLQDSLGGQSKTLMFIHISPEPDALGETVSTLKFAERVSTVELGAARANKDSPDVRELKEQIANLEAALFRKESGSMNGSVTSSPAPSLQSIGDVSKGEQGQTESLAVSRRQSFDGVDFMASPISVVSTEDERSITGDWVDKVMVKRHLGEDGGHSPDIVYQISRCDTSKVYPEQSFSKIATLRRDDRSGRIQFGGAEASDELEYKEVEASDESDYQCQTNGAKQKGGGGTKAKKPTPNQRQMKSPEIRSLIPQPPTRKVGNGSHSPLNKNGKKPATVDGRRKPTSTGGK